MFVIAGASGHTGSVVASTLLAAGKKVRVIVRDEKKGASWKARGAEVAIADARRRRRTRQGARRRRGCLRARSARATAPTICCAAAAPITDAWAQAIAAARPRHVVLLSSIGAELPSGNGPIASLYRTEAKLLATGVKLTKLRAAYFMENWGGMAPPAKSDGVLPSMLTLGRAAPMVATADIGRVAAEALLEGERAPELIELAGPREYTPEEVASAFAAALGRAGQDGADSRAGDGAGAAAGRLQAESGGALPRDERRLQRRQAALERHAAARTVGIDEVVRALVG